MVVADRIVAVNLTIWRGADNQYFAASAGLSGRIGYCKPIVSCDTDRNTSAGCTSAPQIGGGTGRRAELGRLALIYNAVARDGAIA